MHDLNWDDLRYFIEVVRTSNVSEAGKRLRVNPSTVSRRIASLESQLGKTLFDRTTKGWGITPTGEKIVEFAEEMADSVNAVQRKVEFDSKEVSGLVRLAVSDVCAKRFVLPAIRDSKQAHPDVDIELIAIEEELNLAAHDVDIAIRATNTPPPNLVGKHIGTMAFHVYGHEDLLQNMNPNKPPCITWVGDGVTLPHWIKKNFPKLRRAYRTNSAVVMFEMCKAGMGLSLLPCPLGDEADELIRIPVEYIEPGLDVWVLSHVDLRTTARVRLFRERLVEYLIKDLDLLEGRKPRLV